MMEPMEEPDQFENDFDAGVDADEENDPKRFIQQLTGKLSQKLRSYNETQPQPDADLNKYVAGMINKQVSNGLAQDDFDEVLNSLKDDIDGNEEGLATEGISHSRKRIDELFRELTGQDDEVETDGTTAERNYNTLPFLPPQFN
ncbi:MAG: hypothetical protein LUD72_02695 [Bacteroidales bacterium]|nr:hypothetical protein [Bacteroidales bacterium]